MDTMDRYLNTNPLLTYKAVSNPNTLYLHEAMQQPNKHKFLEAMVKEVEDQSTNGNWKIIPRSKVPQGVPIMPAVWLMKRKRKIATREVYKWKARLTLDGSRQKHGVNYWETYAPVASWPMIQLVLSIAVINGWYSKQIDYVLAFPQADSETNNLFMSILKGFEMTKGALPKDYVLHIRKNIYGEKQGSRVWHQHLNKKLEAAGLKQSQIDDCVYTYKISIYILYTDDSILIGPDEQELVEITDRIQATGLEITDDGAIEDFLGVRIKRDERKGTVTLRQPHLIESILQDLCLNGDQVPQQNQRHAPTRHS
jgi:Reverse transcriptase (RNA-dependent DNA polymerase)